MTPEERLQKIAKVRKEHRTTRAHAASVVDAEEAKKNRKPLTPEQIKAEADRMLAAEARESAGISAAQHTGST